MTNWHELPLWVFDRREQKVLMKSQEALGVHFMKPLMLWQCQDRSFLLFHSQDGTYLWPQDKIKHLKNCRLKLALKTLPELTYLNMRLVFL